MRNSSTYLSLIAPQHGCLVAGLVSSLAFLLWYILKQKKSALPLPPSPKSDPFIGHLRFLPSVEEHIVYKRWGDELQSDIISLNMMGQTIIVLNSAEAADEILVRRAAIYSDRPQLQMVRSERLTGWGNNTAFLPYGERWRKQRRMSHEVLHKKASEAFWPTMTKQSRRILQRLLDHPEEYEEGFKCMAAYTLLSSAYGYEALSSNDELVEIVDAANAGLCHSALPGNFFVNVVPWLQHVPSWLPGAGWKRQAHRWREEKERMLHIPFNWTRQQMAAGTAAPSMLRNLLSDLVSKPKESLDIEEEEDRIKWTTGTMFSAANETDKDIASTSRHLTTALVPERASNAQSLSSERLHIAEDNSSLLTPPPTQLPIPPRISENGNAALVQPGPSRITNSDGMRMPLTQASTIDFPVDPSILEFTNLTQEDELPAPSAMAQIIVEPLQGFSSALATGIGQLLPPPLPVEPEPPANEESGVNVVGSTTSGKSKRGRQTSAKEPQTRKRRRTAKSQEEFAEGQEDTVEADQSESKPRRRRSSQRKGHQPEFLYPSLPWL
ncbi:O-methylsterigmatocystin oxidoreductase OS=Aspergillus flavus (strain ATCC 200026 / FGSC A1120 / NRRL 3357 / JCM 12722 / SRRC 167) GN=ordA PE=2 SV=1 [Rhizoctonia solani AG-1 IB]|uniref:O-methylsterigmatocystin oxidoreductase n=1 Tax=Thanatephorus cucumeris (strain AG1-IB / isolate 7/3/14) TaxID=1108050 RepID=A0A0B7FM19_THACB|nr:O-methylsterigmatocystin oxidoreductase OS=Aspergillus flavus (strain ATCC 200026 / FGSC A1120 / NRRL 3357 / JCM 12722 / SRRC 167) GN=ordA PE=2 SV=1 [Rhizoctonia solani AG-1 IB]